MPFWRWVLRRLALSEFYTLSPLPVPTRHVPRQNILIGDISLARYLQRNQIFRSSKGTRLTVDANDWWGESLGPRLSRVLDEDLMQRMPGTSVFSVTDAGRPCRDCMTPTFTSVASSKRGIAGSRQAGD
ncbi:MAG: membrane integrity-associated transporter subunit PqiC [Acetobacteraceae bacterium]|nr:membrane integrity-associated transporter subunit PqiC [Acetobacteraceae bacterium]MBV8525677.1 membrane integrity-associated transporter subunit PqiC [Acetobacteraceae bacterium]